MKGTIAIVFVILAMSVSVLAQQAEIDRHHDQAGLGRRISHTTR